MNWLTLIAASLFEAVVPLLIIRSDNYSEPLYVGLLALTVVSSIGGLRFAMKTISLSIAYMVWTALGIVGTALVGVTLLGETLKLFELLCLGVIVVAVAGLRISAGDAKE